MKTNKKSPKSEKGFILITVLVLSSLAGVVVLSALKDTVTQERMTGNYQKNVNSILASEQGVFSAFDTLTQALKNDPSLSIDDLIDQSNRLQGNNGISQTAFKVTLIESEPGILEVTSNGRAFEGSANVKAFFELVSNGKKATRESPFSKGLTACEKIVVASGGIINSYNSSLGAYSPTNKGENVTIRTLNENGTVDVSGAGTIHGNIISPGNVTFSNAGNISGNVSTNGNLTLSGDNLIGGNVLVNKNYTQKNGTVGGSIHANGNITLTEATVRSDVTSGSDLKIRGKTFVGDLLSQGNISLTNTKINGSVKTHSNFTLKGGIVEGGVRAKKDAQLISFWDEIANNDLIYGGKGRFPHRTKHLKHAPYKISPAPKIDAVPVVELLAFDDGVFDPSDPTDMTCDALDIKTHINVVDAKATSAKDLYISAWGTGDIYTLAKSEGRFTLNNGSSSSATKIRPAITSTFLDSIEQEILVFNNIHVQGHLKVMPGEHVTAYVKGTFLMDKASTLTIPDNSSLTLIMKNKLTITAGGKVYTPDKGVLDNGSPVFSIFSAYDSPTVGIQIFGGIREIYAAIYAPLTRVDVQSGAGFRGAMHGKEITLSGAGGIHYDEALSKAVIGNSTNSVPETSRLIFKGWQQI